MKTSALNSWLKSIRIGHLVGLTVATLAIRHSFYHQLAFHGVLNEILFILPIIFVSAGGNIINDYFDIKEDRLKRPSKSVIGRTLKRRVAMMTHWVFTALAIAISILLASKYDTYIPIIITTMASALLFLYSVWLKKRILLGNVVVASIATSFIVLALCDIDINKLGDKYYWLCCLVFTTVMIRQITKDIDDHEIDKAANRRTLPVAIGINKSWLLIYAFEAFLINLTYYAINYNSNTTFTAFLCSIVAITIFYSVRKKTQAVSAWVRLIIFTGLAWLVLF